MKINQPFFKIILLLLTLISIFIIKGFITLLLTGLIISYALKPFYNWINKLIRNNSLSAIISELIFFITLISLAIFSINSIYYQVSTLSTSIVSQYFNLQQYFNQLNNSNILIDFNDDLTSQIFNIFTKKSIDFALKTPLILVDSLLLIYSVYYFLLHSKKIYESFFQVIPESSRFSVSRFFSKINDLIKELSFGYFLISIFVILFSFIFLNFIRFQMALDYSIFSGIFSLIPMIGNWIIPLFLAIYYFYSKNYFKMILIIAFSFFLNHLIKMIRKITNKDKTIHPILFIFGVVIGFYSFGALGFLIGPILFGILQLGFQEIFSRQKNI